MNTKQVKRGGLTGLAAALLAFSATFLLQGSADAGGQNNTRLEVGEQTGPDKPLAWKQQTAITGAAIVRFRWMSNLTGEHSGAWYVYRENGAQPVARGSIPKGPPTGGWGYFNIDFSKFIPKSFSGDQIKYRVQVGSITRRGLTTTTPTSNAVTVVLAKPGKQPKFTDDMGFRMRQFKIQLKALDVLDEDDPSSDDEPYLMAISFRLQASIVGKKASLVPGTLKTKLVGASCQNNLGHSDDNWCDEDEDPYDLTNQGFLIQEMVPTQQPGWVVGAIVILMEEDAFPYSTAQTLRDKALQAATEALRKMDFKNVNATTISDAVVEKVKNEVLHSLRSLNFGAVDFFKGLAQALDPDDFGGFNVVMATTMPDGSARFLAGAAPASATEAVASSQTLGGSADFRLGYPQGNLDEVPANATYNGEAAVRGTLSTRLIK